MHALRWPKICKRKHKREWWTNNIFWTAIKSRLLQCKIIVLLGSFYNILCIFAVVSSSNYLTYGNRGAMLLQRNRCFSATFNALCLCVSNKLLTHTHTHTHSLSHTHSYLVSKNTLYDTRAKRAVSSTGFGLSKTSFVQFYNSYMCLPISGESCAKVVFSVDHIFLESKIYLKSLWQNNFLSSVLLCLDA